MTTDTPESVKAIVAEINCLLTAHTTLVGAEWEGYGPPKSVREAHAALTRYADLLDQRARKQDGTHSIECWRWHHDCAIARIEAVKRRLIEDRYGSSYYDISSAINGTSA